MQVRSATRYKPSPPLREGGLAWNNLPFPCPSPISAYKGFQAPQSSFLFANWDAAQFRNHWIKPIRVLNILSSILCFNRFGDGDRIWRKLLAALKRRETQVGNHWLLSPTVTKAAGEFPWFWALLFALSSWWHLIGFPVPHLLGAPSSMLGPAGGLGWSSPCAWTPADSMLGACGGSYGSPFAGFAGSVLPPVPGSMLGTVGGMWGLCLGQDAMTALGYSWCVKVYICLSYANKGYCWWEFQRQEKPQNWWAWIEHSKAARCSPPHPETPGLGQDSYGMA